MIMITTLFLPRRKEDDDDDDEDHNAIASILTSPHLHHVHSSPLCQTPSGSITTVIR